MKGVTTKSWVFTAAQADLPLETVGGTNKMAVTYATVTCANDNSVEVAVRIGFAATTLPAITPNSATGMPGMFFEHGGIARGGGAVVSNGGDVVAVGDYGIGPLLTCSVPTGGDVRIVMSWRVLE